MTQTHAPDASARGLLWNPDGTFFPESTCKIDPRQGDSRVTRRIGSAGKSGADSKGRREEMKQITRHPLDRAARVAVVATLLILALVAGSVFADTQYFANGAKQHPTNGGWVLPNQGSCYPDATITTRPECLAQRFAATDEQACVLLGGSAPSVRTWTTSVCNDTVNNADQATCESALPLGSRKWNANGVCAVTMKGYNRNRAVCTNLGGTWVNTVGTCTGTWVMPDATTYTPPLASGSYTGSYAADATGTATTTKKSLPYPANPGPGEQCLRCHNSTTEWNVNRVRDVETFVNTSHQNAARPVVPLQPWAGPSGTAYPTDSVGNAFDWTLGNVSIAGAPKPLYWIHDGWLESPFLPNSIYSTAPVSGKPGVSYSCGRCHTTGWTSDPGTTAKAGKLPERSWPGITWDGVTAPVAGQVNLAGGIAGNSTSSMSSWDQFGILCSRCHSSAAENTTGKCVIAGRTSANCATTNPKGTWWEGQCIATLLPGTCTAAGGSFTAGPPYAGGAIYTVSSAPTSEMSTHHSNLTSPDAGSGYCSDSRFLNKEACIDTNNYFPTAGYPGTTIGTWITPCSDGVQTTQQACLAAGKTWLVSSCSVGPLSYCSTSTYTAATCATNGGVWGIPPTGGLTSTCMLPQFTSVNTCISHAGWKDGAAVSTAWNNQYTDIDACIDATGVWTGSKTQRGQIITALCATCHRQESSGLPYDNGTCSLPAYTDTGTCVKNNGTWTYTGGGLPVKVGPLHNTTDLALHSQANAFLNSPHGQFTGRSSQIATGQYAADGSGLYNSLFQTKGEALNTGNGCTGCHNVHKSIVTAANPAGGGVKECTECHITPDLALINHSRGIGTPLENMVADPSSACETCHMPNARHLFRINTDPTYSTFPASAFALTSGTVTANTAPEGTYTNAVWNDLDASCGQCHGGGASQAATTGSITAGSKVLTVANATGFVTGAALKIAGAAVSGGLPADFSTYVASVSGTSVTLVGAAGTTVAGAAVTVSPTKNGAPYYTKTQLAGVAAGMHDSSGVSYSTTFSYVANGLSVTPTASVNCGRTCPSLTYDWIWGDTTSTLNQTAVTPAPHVYAAAGTYSITLNVRLTSNGLRAGTYTRSVFLTAPDLPPVASATYSFNADTWTATLTDTSTDTDSTPVGSVTVDWGDGTARSGGHGGDTFTHTYTRVGSFTVTQTVSDTKPQLSTATYGPAVPAYFSISGTVMSKTGAPLASASIQVKRGTTFSKTIYTAANGTFTAGNLTPGTYTLTITKIGYAFVNPAATILVGPTSSGNLIYAIAP